MHSSERENAPLACGQLSVIEYVTEEVTRQGHDVTVLDGIERVGWMLNAWSYALRQSVSGKPPTVGVALEIGHLVEPLKNQGTRLCSVRVGSRVCPPYDRLPEMLDDLFAMLPRMRPLEFYRDFEMIHPFEDGNGRTGKVLLNWMNGTLLDPVFPPADLFGHPIRNP